MLDLKKRPPSPYWIARGTINGRRVERSTGTASKSEARERLTQIVQEELAASTRQQAVAWQDKTFAQAMVEYLDNGGEARFLGKVLNHFQETKLGAIDNGAMGRASNALFPDAGAATIRRQLYTPVKAIINLAKDDKLRAPTGGNARTHFLYPAQAEAAIKYATTQRNQAFAAMLTGLIGQGLRVSEIVAINAKHDVSVDHRHAIIRDPKNKEPRYVTLIPRVVAAWSTLPTLGEDGPLFLTRDGRPYKERKGRGGHIRNAFTACMEGAGIDAGIFTPHHCRHTWATWFLACTQDTMRLKAEGGWKSNEWQRYTKLAPPNMAQDVMDHGWDFSQVVGEKWGKNAPNIAKPGISARNL